MKKLLIAVVLITAFISCDDDETFETISFTIPADFEQVDSEKWIFVSDADGNLLDIGEVQNEGIVTLKIPTGASRPLCVNFFTAKMGTSEVTREIQSYGGVTADEYIISERVLLTPHAAKFNLRIENRPSGYLGLTGDVTQWGSIEDTIRVWMPLERSTPGKVLACLVLSSDPRFMMFDAYPNMSYQFSYDEFAPFTTTGLITPSGTATVAQQVLKGERWYPLPSTTMFNPTSSLYFPLYSSSSLDGFHTMIRHEHEGIKYKNDYVGSEVPKSFAALEASAEFVSQSDQGFSITTSGPGDVIEVGYNESEVINGIKYIDRRTVLLPFQKDVKFNHPTIPDVLLQAYFPTGNKEYTFKDLTITDFETIDHAAFLDFRLHNPFDDPKTTAKRKSFTL